MQAPGIDSDLAGDERHQRMRRSPVVCNRGPTRGIVRSHEIVRSKDNVRLLPRVWWGRGHVHLVARGDALLFVLRAPPAQKYAALTQRARVGASTREHLANGVAVTRADNPTFRDATPR
jgi:hypothetical protein